MTVPVSVDNFVRAETARMFDGVLATSGGVNEWVHLRAPVPLDAQSVIRMNRDTLYSAAIVDISGGATLRLPDAGDRYLSVMVVNEDHYINRILHDPGEHRLTTDELDTLYVSVNARIFVDPTDAGDVERVNTLQNALEIDAASRRAYTHPAFDPTSLDAARKALLELAEGVPDARRTFGSRDEVDPVRHLVGTAFGWGGLPEREAFYFIESEPRPARRERITFADVPVDAFWSFTVYNRDGFLEANPYDVYSLNSVTARPEPDGTVSIDLSPTDDGYRNHLYVMDGWNYAIRLYRPRPEVLDGTWVAPRPHPVD